MLTLVTGTAAAQAVGILLQPVLSRLYSPAVTGEMAVYVSITGIIISIAALRYDMTVMLPESDDDARQLWRLAMTSIAIISALTSLGAAIAFPWVQGAYGRTFALIMLFAGVSVFFVASSTAMQFWFNRKENYRTIAINRAQQTTSILLAQIGLGFAGIRTVVGLFVGTLAGQIFAWSTIFRKSKELRAPLSPNALTKRQLAYRYRKMPLLNGPNTLVDAVRFNGIILLLTASFGSAVGGEFVKAWALTEAPVALLNGAIAQVFFQRLARTERGEMFPLVSSSIKRSLLLGIVPFVVLYLAAPPVVGWYLGVEWQNSGLFAQALVPWLYMQLTSSPISYIFVVTEKQQIMLIFAVFYAVVPLGFLWLSNLSVLATIQVLALIMAAMLAIMVVMSMFVAKSYDQEQV